MQREVGALEALSGVRWLVHSKLKTISILSSEQDLGVQTQAIRTHDLFLSLLLSQQSFRWEGRYVVGYDDNGLPVTKNVLAKTKSEYAAKLKTLADSISAPTPDQPRPGILLGDWLDLWYQSYKRPNLRPLLDMAEGGCP